VSESDPTTIIEDEIVCLKQLAIVEKYVLFLDYFYPVVQNMRRTHGTLSATVFSRPGMATPCTPIPTT